MIETAEAAITNNKAPLSKSGLPLLGSQPSTTARIHEVELPDSGAFVLLSKPNVAAILDIQEKVDFDKASMREMYAGTVGLVANMLVQPELSGDELRALVDNLSFSDWQHLQDEALALAGLGEDARKQAEAEFPVGEQPA